MASRRGAATGLRVRARGTSAPGLPHPTARSRARRTVGGRGRAAWYAAAVSDPQAASPAILLVTGANGHLGRSLCLGAQGTRIRAVVRSERAASVLRSLPQAARPEIHVLDPTDAEALATVAEGAVAWAHLVGILKEGSRARYREAHEESCERVAQAAARAGVRRIVYPSILGASVDSPNACLASKARAEAILLAGPVPTTVLRVPMVLGPGELAAAALLRQASSRLAWLPDGGRSLEQPLDSDDLRQAVQAAARDLEPGDRVLELAGPEALSHRELVARAAAVLGRRAPRVLPLPVSLVRGAARLLERLLADPPLTEAMLEVLQRDDRIDPRGACKELGLELTPLDETLRRSFAARSERT